MVVIAGLGPPSPASAMLWSTIKDPYSLPPARFNEFAFGSFSGRCGKCPLSARKQTFTAQRKTLLDVRNFFPD
jgi:hypothetical protein